MDGTGAVESVGKEASEAGSLARDTISKLHSIDRLAFFVSPPNIPKRVEASTDHGLEDVANNHLFLSQSD